jgi:hypothetical protein
MANALFGRANLQSKYNVTPQKTSSGHFQPRRLQGLQLRVSYISGPTRRSRRPRVCPSRRSREGARWCSHWCLSPRDGAAGRRRPGPESLLEPLGVRELLAALQRDRLYRLAARRLYCWLHPRAHRAFGEDPALAVPRPGTRRPGGAALLEDLLADDACAWGSPAVFCACTSCFCAACSIV